MKQIILNHHGADHHATSIVQPGEEGVLETHICQGNTHIQMFSGTRTCWKAHSCFKSYIQILTLLKACFKACLLISLEGLQNIIILYTTATDS